MLECQRYVIVLAILHNLIAFVSLINLQNRHIELLYINIF